jgi:GT2 family glycosyltransferase
VNDPMVWVIVVNWNGREHLETCLDSLEGQTYAARHVLFVDNGSSDGSVEFVRDRFPNVEILANVKNLGFCDANNQGLRLAMEAGAPYAVLLNNDTETDLRWLEELVGAAERLPEAGVLASKMLLFDKRDTMNSAGLCCSVIGCGWDRGFGEPDGPKWDEPAQVIGACGGAFFVRTAALARTGLLPRFGIYLEDLDLSLRMWNAGYTIEYVPTAVVYHKFSATMASKSNRYRRAYLNARNRLQVLMRQFPMKYCWRIWTRLARAEIRAVGRPILDGEWWKARAEICAILAAGLRKPAALVERCRAVASGRGTCRFWHLIDETVDFFPGPNCGGEEDCE